METMIGVALLVSCVVLGGAVACSAVGTAAFAACALVLLSAIGARVLE